MGLASPHPCQAAAGNSINVERPPTLHSHSEHSTKPFSSISHPIFLLSPCRAVFRHCLRTTFLGLAPPGTPLLVVLNRLPGPTTSHPKSLLELHIISPVHLHLIFGGVCFPSDRRHGLCCQLRIRPRPGHSRRTPASERPRLMQTWVTASSNLAFIITFIEPVFKR